MKTNEFIEEYGTNPDLIDSDGNVYTYWSVQEGIKEAINDPDTDEVQVFYYDGVTADSEEILRHVAPRAHMSLVLQIAFSRYEKWVPGHRWSK